MIFRQFFFAALGVGVMVTGLMMPAAAQGVTSQNPDKLADFLRERGQTVIVTVDEYGDPFIETSINNTDYNVVFYGCLDHIACTSLTLRAQRSSTGSASYQAMNAWNTDQRWTKLYTADVNSAILEMDLLFAAGPLSEQAFAAYLDKWDRSLEQFVRYIDDGDFSFVE